MKPLVLRLFLAHLATSLLLAALVPCRAADHYWKNISGGDFFNNNRWSNGVPGVSDNAVFLLTNSFTADWSASATNANAYFDAAGGTVTLNIGSNKFWWLTNSFVVGRNAGATAAVTHTTGTLRVTNAAGTGRLVIGENGKGTFNLNGGSVVADQLFVTNNGPGFTNSVFNFNHGDLTTLNGSALVSQGPLFIGNTPGQTATWRMLGGTNSFLVISNDVVIGNGFSNGLARVIVDGSNTVWTNAGGVGVNSPTGGSEVMVTNGAQVFSTNLGIGNFVLGSSNSVVTVVGTNSRWTITGTGGSGINVGNTGTGNRLDILDGAFVSSPSLSVGNIFSTSSANEVRVSGAEARLVTGTLTVGSSGGLNRLSILDGGNVSNSSAFTVGGTSSALSNVVLVSGSGSVFTSAGGTSIGSSGSSNLMVVSNGGFVTNLILNVGFSASAVGNQVLVTGPGSEMGTSSRMVIGVSGSGNRLEVSDGARVVGRTSTIIGQNGSGNSVWVTGPGTLLTNQGTVFVGSNSVGNLLITSNGGAAFLRQLLIGDTAIARSNVAVITGAGSQWQAGTVIVGQAGSFNLAVVSNGATASATNLIVGVDSGATNNVLAVSDATLLVTNPTGTGSVVVGQDGQGALHFNGGTIVANRLFVTNNGPGFTNSVFNFNYGDLTTLNGATIAQSNQFLIGTTSNQTATWLISGGTNTLALGAGSDTILGNSNGSRGVVTVTGSATVWSNSGTLRIGDQGSSSQLTVSNGGGVWVGGHGYLGFTTNGGANSALVTGTNSYWNIASNLYVGYSNSGNQLTVSGNGSVTVASYLVLGLGATSDSNRVLVTGAGSLIESGILGVGGFGRGNQLVVSNGGTLISSFAYFEGASLGSNSLWITGPGSVWSNANRVDIGVVGGSGNQLIVSNGGRFINSSNFVRMLSSDNLMVVDGPGSFLSSQNEVEVGTGGSRNQLLVRNGGWVADSEGRVGVGSSASSNFALVTGAGSVWSNTNALYVGTSGDGNLLSVGNNGLVTAPTMVISDQSAASNNSLTVTGGHLRATNVAGTGSLVVGRNGRGTLNFNGGTIVADQLFVTNNGPGYTNSVFNFNHGTLTTLNGSTINYRSNSFAMGTTPGALTEWHMLGGTNLLQVLPNSLDVIIGSNAAATLLVSGGGTLFSNNSVDFIVGGSAVTNSRLIVSNGAVFRGPSLDIGSSSTTSRSNLVHITGAGSLVAVGASGSFVDLIMRSSNQLLVTDGGQLSSRIVEVGSPASSVGGNSIIVSNAGSLWTNAIEIRLGEDRGNNRLTIADAGTVSTPLLTVGRTNTSLNNLLTVNDGNLVVTNPSQTGTLDMRHGALLFNGGTIVADQLFVTNGANSVFNFNAGTLNVRTTVVASTQPFFIGNGTSNATMNLVGNGTHSFPNGLTIRTNAALTGNGTILGTVTNFGTIAPGNSAGSLTVNGSLRLTNSSLMSFEIGGLIPTNQYDQVTVTNFVEFAGTLSLSLLNNFLPGAADTFTLVSFGSASGSFANISGGRVSLTNNLASFAVTQTATNLVLGGVTYTDTDGDGQGDLQEQAAGTDPNNSASVLMITSITANILGQTVIQWQSVSGKSYRAEYSDNLVTWTTVVGPTFTDPAAGLKQWIDDGTLTGGLSGVRRNYRIGLQ